MAPASISTLFKFEHRRRSRPLEPAQHRLDPRHQLARGERLGDVVVRAHLQALNAIILRGARRQEDDRNHAQRGILPQPAAEIEAVSAGHHNVQQKKRRRLAVGVGNNLADGRIGANGVAGALQMVLHQPRDVGIVFQHKDRLTQFVTSCYRQVNLHVTQKDC